MVRRLIAGLTILACANCSPYPYSEPTGDLKGSTKEIASFIQDTRSRATEEIARREAIRLRPAIASGTTTLALSTDCERAMNGQPFTLGKDFNCQVEVVTGKTDRRPLFRKDQLERFDTAAKVAKDLDAYAAALVAITNADDQTALKTSAGKLCTAAGGIATVASAPIGAVLGPACGLLAQVSVMGLAHARYTVLREGVAAMDEAIMPRAVDMLGEALDMMGALRLRELRRTTELQGPDLKATAAGQIPSLLAYEALVVGTVARANTITALARSIEPAPEDQSEPAKAAAPAAQLAPYTATTRNQVARALLTAHGKLQTAIQNNDGQLAAVATAMADLSGKVQDLRKAVAKNED